MTPLLMWVQHSDSLQSPLASYLTTNLPHCQPWRGKDPFSRSSHQARHSARSASSVAPFSSHRVAVKQELSPSCDRGGLRLRKDNISPRMTKLEVAELGSEPMCLFSFHSSCSLGYPCRWGLVGLELPLSMTSGHFCASILLQLSAFHILRGSRAPATLLVH